jgi:hypothetical protein
MPEIKRLNVGVTSYSSAEDWAMWISHRLRSTRARVGSGPIYVPGVDAIDITGLGDGPLALNHNVFVYNYLVFGDMARLMATSERPPDKRTPLFVPVATAGGTHWEYKGTTRT